MLLSTKTIKNILSFTQTSSTFVGNDMDKNYQVSKAYMTNIEDGSEFISGKLKTRIAEVTHFIIPQLRGSDVFTDDIFDNITFNSSDSQRFKCSTIIRWSHW